MTRRPPRKRLGLVGYGVLGGIIASATGAWVSSAASGVARIGIWSGVTAFLALVLAWFAETALLLLGRCLRQGLGHRPLSR